MDEIQSAAPNQGKHQESEGRKEDTGFNKAGQPGPRSRRGEALQGAVSRRVRKGNPRQGFDTLLDRGKSAESFMRGSLRKDTSIRRVRLARVYQINSPATHRSPGRAVAPTAPRFPLLQRRP